MKKRLIINKNLAEDMTFEQTLAMFQPLIRGNICKWGQVYEPDDIISICNMYLWKAYQTYDYRHGVSFSHYADVVVGRGLIVEFRSDRRHKEVMSLNSFVKSPSGDDTMIEAIETIMDETDYAEIAVTLLYIREKLDEAEPEYKEIFIEHYKKDLTQDAIAKKHNMTQKKVSEILKSIRIEIQRKDE